MFKIEDILSQLPGFIFLKDKNSNYLAANDNFIKSAGLFSLEEIIGKNDFEMPWKLFAEKYRFDDQLIVNSQQQKHLKEYHIDISGKMSIATVHKKPLWVGKEIVGLICHYSKIELVDNLSPKQKLSKRQKEILNEIANGFSAKQIAAKLSISKRTVEFYIELIKSKLGSRNRAELVKKAIYLGYGV